MLRAILYIRVSTEEQAKEGYSIPAQKDRLESFCHSQGWLVEAVYIEDGYSAKDMRRPELQRMLRDIEAGAVTADILLVWRLDRLTRRVLDLYTILEFLEKHKMGFRSATEVYDTTTAIGRLFLTLVGAMAQWERENLGERVRMGFGEMSRQGKRPPTPAPYGYEYLDGELVQVPEEAAIVRQLYEMYARGKGVRSLVKWLNGQKVPTKTGVSLWSDATVSLILKNPVYMGKFAWGRQDGNRNRAVTDDILFVGSHEPIISEDLWHAVQRTFARRKQMPPRYTTSRYPLTGVLYCGLCGNTMYGGTNRGYRIYQCATRDHKRACSMQQCVASKLETAVLERVRLLSGRDMLKAYVAEALAEENKTMTDVDRRALEKELAAIKRKKARWYDLYEDGEMSKADLKARLAALSEREGFIVQQLQTAQEKDKGHINLKEALLTLRNIVWHWENATDEERKELIRAAFERIDVFPSYEVKVKLRW